MAESTATFPIPVPVPPAIESTAETGLIYQPDHAGDAESKLLRQFDDAAKLHALVRALVLPMQALEIDAFQVMGAFDIYNATGKSLDLLGGFVGVEREGRSDITYRAYVQARILGNASDGQPRTMYRIARALVGAAPTLTLTPGFHEGHPAHFDFSVRATALAYPWDTLAVEPSDVVARGLADALALAVSAGVSLTLFYQLTPNGFTFASGDVEEDSTTRGFADDSEDGPIGGALIGVEERGT